MAENVMELTEGNFESEVAQSDSAVLADFWAPWCGPCLSIAPMIEELAGEYNGRLKVGKINVDDNPGLASKFGIQSIPTLLIFKGGEAVERIIGATQKQSLVEAINKHI